MTIKAVIFDFDGVIVDSEELSARADEISLAKFGIAMTEEEKKNAMGRRMEDIYNDLLRDRKLQINTATLIGSKDTVYTELIKGNLKTIPNSIELVNFLRDLNVPLALATSSHSVKMKAAMDEVGITGMFDVTVTGEEVTKGKPDPEAFLKAAEKLGVEPGECAVVEDAMYGIEAAKKADMFAIGYLSPNSRGQDLSKADIIVRNLAEIQKLLEC